MILHHWDADGICSAAMLLRLGEDENFTPKIGNYFLDDEDMEYLRRYDEIKIVDMNLPDASKLCEFAKIWIYDHHAASRVECAVEHVNPSLLGKSSPSATLVVMEKFDFPFDYLVALGIIGDNGPKTKELKEYEAIKKAADREGLSYEELEKAVKLLDSSYKMNDRHGVQENVHLVRNGIRAILENEKLNRNMEEIEKEIEKWASMAKEIDGIFALKMNNLS